ncbi:hypothetical protein [Hymenobacter volaticus]|uniref:Uncharacterized protein n=1 Tax=Hymenobacter volaticus TaxID=2932254 RepID=A0ABY4G8J2_9BACT|nr:hypothetical protein [Hymenobacter volaticus]UOQ66789.1 hypothetical protein MUN86_02385 [Hymenobacter volaticus]
MLDKQCPICGTYFVGRSDKQFCSGRCRVSAHRQGYLSEEEHEEEQDDGRLLPAPEPAWEPDLPWLQPIIRSDNQGSIADPASAGKQADITALIRAAITRSNEQDTAAELARQQQADAALAREIHEVYVKAIEPFLHCEGQRLDSNMLQAIADCLIDAREDYKDHPYLSQPDHVARLRLNDLWDALLIVQEAQQEAKASWLSGRTAHYDLKGKWRKQLRERLLT